MKPLVAADGASGARATRSGASTSTATTTTTTGRPITELVTHLAIHIVAGEDAGQRVAAAGCSGSLRPSTAAVERQAHARHADTRVFLHVVATCRYAQRQRQHRRHVRQWLQVADVHTQQRQRRCSGLAIDHHASRTAALATQRHDGAVSGRHAVAAQHADAAAQVDTW